MKNSQFNNISELENYMRNNGIEKMYAATEDRIWEDHTAIRDCICDIDCFDIIEAEFDEETDTVNLWRGDTISNETIYLGQNLDDVTEETSSSKTDLEKKYPSVVELIEIGDVISDFQLHPVPYTQECISGLTWRHSKDYISNEIKKYSRAIQLNV